jgi:hypothetical protein
MSNFTDFFPAAGGGGGSIPKYQDFTSSGTFTPTQALIDAGGRVSYFIVAGGERGRFTSGTGARGGAGGQVKWGYMTLNATTGCAVIIGAGGSASEGANGGDSSVAFNSAGGTAVTAAGGAGEQSAGNGSNHGGYVYSGNSSAYAGSSAHSGVLGYGSGGSGYENGSFNSGGMSGGPANSGYGGTRYSNGASGFVRITWHE